jgi:GNAT superfamily N-acetyltransferase
MVTVRPGTDADLERVRAFYRTVDYVGSVGIEDQLVLAEEVGAIVGVLRLAREHGFAVLRGMRVSPSHQRRGIGTLLLNEADRILGPEPCYCIPYEHLLSFYGQIGFQDIDPALAPAFLRERLNDYRQRRPQAFRLMLRRWLPTSVGC